MIVRLKITLVESKIELVEYGDDDMPVVYRGKVYQLCVSDSDGDCIMKDTINGVKIIYGCFSGDRMYDEELIEKLDTHPFREVQQIKQNGSIIGGETNDLQKIIDSYYGK